jgi:hypothetical protein
MIETQAVPIDVDKLPFVLHLKYADIAPPLTLICRRCGTERLWTERECFGCQVAMTEQQRQRVMGDDSEAGKQ